jgi:hypothetical protein
VVALVPQVRSYAFLRNFTQIRNSLNLRPEIIFGCGQMRQTPLMMTQNKLEHFSLSSSLFKGKA